MHFKHFEVSKNLFFSISNNQQNILLLKKNNNNQNHKNNDKQLTYCCMKNINKIT